MSARSHLFLALLTLASAPFPANAVVRGTASPGGFGAGSTVDFEPDTPPLTETFQQEFSYGEPPAVRFVRSATATVDGDYGFFSTYALAELNGIPPTEPGFYGVSSDVDIYAIDRFNVESELLEDGTEVELAVAMDVQGNGRVDARMYVERQEGTQLFDELSLSYSASGGGTVSGTPTGSFTALVGKRYRIEYSMGTSLGVTPSGLSEANPTKFLVSDYQARFYVTPVSEPAVVLDSTSGHDYTAVPEPQAAVAALAALAKLGWRFRRCARRT
jgi:hypothetical protein